jgi:DNA modification methylase
MDKTLKKIFDGLADLQTEVDLPHIRKNLSDIKSILASPEIPDNISNNGFSKEINKNFLLKEIEQIINTRTLERTRYYIKRLIKGLSEERSKDINDINLNRWKDYNEIITDSLWIINKRDSSGFHNANYWGNFIPQIPNQLLKRYTKKGDWVLDPFLGSGTTLIECQRLGRNGIGIELLDEVNIIAKELLRKEKEKLTTDLSSKINIVTGDSSTINIKSILDEEGINKIQFILMHPPYWDIIKFSEAENDLSNAKDITGFLKGFGNVLDNVLPHLEKKRFFAVVIGDKYSKGEWIPLGFYLMNEIFKRKCILKSIVVKNFEDTLAKRNQKELWRYRALSGGFYIFKHEYILIFQKKGS